MDSEGSDQCDHLCKKRKDEEGASCQPEYSRYTDELLGRLYQIFGEKNVKAVEKYIENAGKMH